MRLKSFFTLCLSLNCFLTYSQNKNNIKLPEEGSKKAIIVHIGDILTFSGRIHESVGFTMKYKVSNTILKYQKLDIKYNHPSEPGSIVKTGGDDAIGTYLFKAVAKGKAKLIIQKLFRGNKEKEIIFNIIIQ